jgi:hypothetical protein
MKRIIASAGLVALGATTLQAQYAPGLTRLETSKPWSVSATLRGFYDDNYVAAPNLFADEQDIDVDSFGFELKPTVALNFPWEQTFLGASYTYSMRYYESREDDPLDHQHEVNLKVDHRFNERYKASLSDSFVYAQEPELLEGTGLAQTTFRTRADALRNRAAVEGSGQLTELLGLALGYQNTWYDFLDEGDFTRSALLDRVEHLFRIDGRYTVRPELIGVLGYQYGIADFTSDEAIAIAGPVRIPGDIRDNTSHYLYVGGDYTMSARFTASGRVGARYTDYDNLDESEVAPYVDLAGTYTYLPGSYIQGGVRLDRNATDLAGNVDNITADQDSATIYASLNHRITPRLTGSLLGQFQHSTFNQGLYDDDVDNFLLAGANLNYAFSQYLSAEAGYNYDRLDSDLGSRLRSFTRNRVYVGVRGTY